MPQEFTNTISETTVEKLVPPTTVAGRTAYIAEVTRVYDQHFPSLKKTLNGEPRIEIIWDTTPEIFIAAAEQKKTEVVAKADAEVAKQDEIIAALSKADAAVDPIDVGPVVVGP